MSRGNRGLDALTEAMTQAPAAVHLVTFEGVPRLFLSPREVALICGVDYRVVLNWIHDGLIDTAKEALGTAHYPIPVSELLKLQSLAYPRHGEEPGR